MDTPDCITNNSVACKTLYYALNRPTDLINFDLRVRPGNYSVMNDHPIHLRRPVNFTIRGEGEVIFRCRGPTPYERFGDFAIYDGVNVNITGITVKNCGPNATGIYVERAENLRITNCTFR